MPNQTPVKVVKKVKKAKELPAFNIQKSDTPIVPSKYIPNPLPPRPLKRPQDEIEATKMKKICTEYIPSAKLPIAVLVESPRLLNISEAELRMRRRASISEFHLTEQFI